MIDFRQAWYVGSGGGPQIWGGTSRPTHVVCRHRMRTSFAYLFWLASNKKVKYLVLYGLH